MIARRHLCPGWTIAAAAALGALPAARADQSIADFSAEPDRAIPSPASRPAPPSPPGAAVSAHSAIEPVPGGYRCRFENAPFAEAVVELANAWRVPVAYFGPARLRTSAAFTAQTAAAALAQIANRTALRVVRRGEVWCLEERPDEGDAPPESPAPLPQ
jgi:hypothetical protein